jgi:methylated-DNA-[protein]-cysteine S-methyltransferase
MADEAINYTAFDTSAGWVGVLGSTSGLLLTTLPQRSLQEARQLLGDKANHAIWSTRLFENLMERLKNYYSGDKVTFPDDVDLSGATPFQIGVWSKTRLIPYGETRSYSWVAEQIGRPGVARAVGQALGRNPLPGIIPCHRVVASDGKLCGFAGGLAVKRHLLSLEAPARTR